MVCLNCKKSFYITRTFLTLFSTKHYFICEICRNNFPLMPRVEAFGLEEYQLMVLSLLDNGYPFIYDAYLEEYSKIVAWVLQKYPEYLLFIKDKLYLSDFILESLSFLADVEKKNILAICFQLKKQSIFLVLFLLKKSWVQMYD